MQYARPIERSYHWLVTSALSDTLNTNYTGFTIFFVDTHSHTQTDTHTHPHPLPTARSNHIYSCTEKWRKNGHLNGREPVCVCVCPFVCSRRLCQSFALVCVCPCESVCERECKHVCLGGWPGRFIQIHTHSNSHKHPPLTLPKRFVA